MSPCPSGWVEQPDKRLLTPAGAIFGGMFVMKFLCPKAFTTGKQEATICNFHVNMNFHCNFTKRAAVPNKGSDGLVFLKAKVHPLLARNILFDSVYLL
jgi:hypothetical protein